jgi:hypothetical protein
MPLFFVLTGIISISGVVNAEEIIFKCTRTEHNYTEDYELKVVSADVRKGIKAKIFVDGRDLSQTSNDVRQEIKGVSISNDKVIFLIDTYFSPEQFEGNSYDAGYAIALTTISRSSGLLKRVETIQGGFLGSSMGEGTKIYTEKCSL